ncbi:ABC transporter ATP-binding protein [Nocardioides flavus (ex Wang et al. 2016)]|uniref:ABC transporter ATP-binding protein n=1 Tax=Nocardioides flavus (ex Wang et al. 2016) TaxID=2058780 RepID=A0ABQ3HNJ6_9ACTN|nr:ABC transporter ATP-binding protein [Nocardioides flavus (ex Wang et al. 2016)]GHE17714.1 ABC transporter ATP-binding protein [Nocardioides flavus (ex Wang et al. 2016)]
MSSVDTHDLRGPAVPAPAGRPVMRTSGLGFAVGGVRIVSDVDLDVRQGEFLAVIGPNGAGKTTLFNLLTGLYRPTSGSIELAGDDVTRLTPAQRARRGMARSFQVTSLFTHLSVLENVRLAARAHLGGSARLLGRIGRGDEAVRRAEEALETVGLADRATETAANLSHGNKRKLDLAIAIAGEPRVLLLDEPTAGMGADDLPPVIDLIGRIHARGTTIVMVEHRMDLILGLADRIAVMHHGSLLACDEPDTVMADPTVQTAYLGEPL